MNGPASRARPARRSPAERRERNAGTTDPEVVLAAGLRFLEARARSAAEVRRRLASAGYAVALVEATVERLVELGFIDDAAFARAWVESRDRARPRGERALRSELARKGIDRALVDAVLEERREPEAEGGPGRTDPEEDAAARLLARHARALARIADPRVRRQRAYALLARSGFDPEVASAAMRTLAEVDREESIGGEDGP